MKKTLTIVALSIMMIVTIAVTGVNAASSSTLASDLYSKLSAYGLTAGDRVKIERYVSEKDITDEQAATILAKADEAIAIMDANNVKNVRKLNSENRNKVISKAQEAASVLGLTLTVSNETVTITDANGKVIEKATISNDGKLSYTGNSVNIAVVVSSIAVIALAVAVVAKINFKRD